MRNIRSVLWSALVAAAVGAAALLPQTGASQGTALPKSPGAALRSGWQIAHFSVGYAAMPRVTSYNDVISTQLGSDEVHYYVMRKDANFILCFSQLVWEPGAMKYSPWKHECLVIG